MAGSLARALPSVDLLLRQPLLEPLAAAVPHALLLDAARSVLDDARRASLEAATPAPDIEVLSQRVRARLDDLLRLPLRRVINATGVVVHTNLGRSPLSQM